MIRSSDIDSLVNRRHEERETVEEWCGRNDVDHLAIRRVAEIYGGFRDSASISIAAFQLGYDARCRAEPSGERSAGWVAGGPRYAVQYVVVDTANGRIRGDATSTLATAEGLAGTYNELDSDAASDSRQ